MGNSASRIDRFYGTYEKSFTRIEQDVTRVKARIEARSRRRSSLAWWTAAGVALAVAVAMGLIYQVQQRPVGSISYQQHFQHVGGALALPAAAAVLHWVLALVLGVLAGRDQRKLAALQAAKRGMIKDLKDMSRFDKIKTLIDKFDPDARPPAPVLQPGSRMLHGAYAAAGHAHPGGLQLRPQQPGQVPALLVKGSGQVAGAAALAVAGAGRALMPLVDKLATTLISDNPMLLEDLRRAQAQLSDAELRAVGAVQESFAVKSENLGLKQRLVELERQLDLPPSFDPAALQEQEQQLQQAVLQATWPAQAGSLQLPPGSQQLDAPGTPQAGQDAGAADAPALKPGAVAGDGAAAEKAATSAVSADASRTDS